MTHVPGTSNTTQVQQQSRVMTCMVKFLAIGLVFCFWSSCEAFCNPPAFRTHHVDTDLHMGLMEDVTDGFGSFMKRFTMKANASHILIKGGAEAENKLEDIKIEIGDDYSKFVEAAKQYSECPSAKNGGNLGAFGPGAMVKEFDEVVFNSEVGKIHGPVKTMFGYHLIRINDRSD